MAVYFPFVRFNKNTLESIYRLNCLLAEHYHESIIIEMYLGLMFVFGILGFISVELIVSIILFASAPILSNILTNRHFLHTLLNAVTFFLYSLLLIHLKLGAFFVYYSRSIKIFVQLRAIITL